MLKKKEMQECITKLLNEVNDQKRFCEKYGISEVDFYPFAFGYMFAELEFIEADGNIFKQKNRMG